MSENNYTMAVLMGHTYALTAYMSEGGQPTLLDRTGGYGALEVPLIMCWLRHESRYIIGEEAKRILPEEGIGIGNVIERSMDGRAMKIQGSTMTGPDLVGIYLRELVRTIYEINPKAQVDCLRLSLPEDLLPETVGMIKKSVEETLDLTVDLPGTGALGESWAGESTQEDDRMWLDLSDDTIRLYSASSKDGHKTFEKVSETDLGLGGLRRNLNLYITEAYLKFSKKEALTIQEKDHIESMMERQINSLFFRSEEGKGLRMTFGQVYPPFQLTLTPDRLKVLTEPVLRQLRMKCEAIQSLGLDKPLFVSGEHLRQRWASRCIEGSCTLPISMDWSGPLFAMLTIGPTHLGGASRCFEAALALLPEGQPPLIVAEAGTVRKGFFMKFDLVVTQASPMVRLYERQSDGSWEPYSEVVIELKDRPMAIIQIDIKTEKDGELCLTPTMLPL